MRDFIKKIEIETIKTDLTLKSLGRNIHKYSKKPVKIILNEYETPVIIGLINTRDKIALALQTTKENLISHIIDKLNHLKKYNEVNQAPFLKNQVTISPDSHLDKLIPLIDFYEGKKYTTSSIVAVNFPGEDRQNLSFHRMMYLGGNKFAIRVVAQRHLDISYQDALKRGEDLKVAVIFGVHPAIEIASSFSAANLDELELASAFLNGLDVVRLSNNVLVPVMTEFVMEARITKNLTDEGPFVDLTETLDHVRKQPILEVDKLYIREDPLFRTIIPGGDEHRMLMGIPQEPRMFRGISNTIGTVKNVVLTNGGCCWLHAVVQIEKRTEGDPSNAIMATLASHPSLKRVVIVDEDIDITNPDDVEWAIATRVQPDKDIIFFPNSKGSSLDPSSNESITCKWGIDATKPLKNNQEYNKVDY